MLTWSREVAFNLVGEEAIHMMCHQQSPASSLHLQSYHHPTGYAALIYERQPSASHPTLYNPLRVTLQHSQFTRISQVLEWRSSLITNRPRDTKNQTTMQSYPIVHQHLLKPPFPSRHLIQWQSPNISRQNPEQTSQYALLSNLAFSTYPMTLLLSSKLMVWSQKTHGSGRGNIRRASVEHRGRPFDTKRSRC